MKSIIWLPICLGLIACSDADQAGESTSTTATSVASTPMPLNTEPSDSIEAALAAANAAIATATDVGHVWSTSIQLLEAANSAAAAGDDATAIELADEARMHADLAIVQAGVEADTWRNAVISD